VIARLKPAVSEPMANAQLKLAADQYRATYPGTLGPNNSFGVVLLQELMVRRGHPFTCCWAPSDLCC